MRRSLITIAMALAGLAVAAMPRNADACSRCDEERARCIPAINTRCSTYTKVIAVCEQYSTSCAYAYAPDEISADGSIVSLAASPASEAAGEQVRGCHGLIVDRAYSDARQAQARAGSRSIVL